MKETIRKGFMEAQKSLEEFIADTSKQDQLLEAIELICSSFSSGGKVIACGNGGSMCDAMHFAEELSGKYRNDRKALPALAISDQSHISCTANDYGYDFVFSRFLEAHGNKNDVLLAISTSGNSKNVLEAIKMARERQMKVIGLTGKDGGEMKEVCDIEIRAPYSEYADRAQEIHIKIIHAIIQGIEIKMDIC